MSLLSDRIKIALDHSGLTPAELARRSGVKRQSVNDWIHGGTKRISGEALLKAAAALGVSAAWLASGKGQMLDRRAQIPPEDQEQLNRLAALYLSADEKGKTLIAGVAESVGAYESPLESISLESDS